MRNQYNSLTMSILVDKDSVTLSHNKEFMLPLMIFLPAFLGMILTLYTLPALLKWLLVFFFLASLSGLIAHLKNFIKGEDVFVWKVDHTGFYFQALRTNFLSLKPPLFQPWPNIAKVFYVKKYITLDHELDTVTLKNSILIFTADSPEAKILQYPHSQKIGADLFKVIQALAPQDSVFESLKSYNDA